MPIFVVRGGDVIEIGMGVFGGGVVIEIGSKSKSKSEIDSLGLSRVSMSGLGWWGMFGVVLNTAILICGRLFSPQFGPAERFAGLLCTASLCRDSSFCPLHGFWGEEGFGELCEVMAMRGTETVFMYIEG